MTTVGIKDLKAHLSKYVRRAASGKEVTITERGLPVAVLAPLSPAVRGVLEMRRKGLVRWSGGKPDVKLIRLSPGANPDVSGAVIEMRDEDERRL